MACTLKRSREGTSLSQVPCKRLRCNPPTERDEVSNPFDKVPLVQSDDLIRNLRNRIKSLHNHMTLIPAVEMEHTPSPESADPRLKLEHLVNPDKKSEKALFTFKQMQAICQNIMREREERLREHYESLLNTKLAEQYDIFVKFTYDQLLDQHQKPTYLS